MELTKEQSFDFLISESRLNSFTNKYKFTTKTKWYCLNCLKPIYISYKQSGIYSIFCDKCFLTYQNRPTIAQYYYIKKLKEIQLNLIESQINLDNN
jgi:hypothetical protein